MGGVAWSEEEDQLLRKCIEQYGEGKWHRIPLLAGINRCRKSCRLRWLNYLRPNIKRGKFTDEEVQLIIKLHNMLGNRWSLIAGRLPGRTANDVKNYWHCHLSKRLNSNHQHKSKATNQSPKEQQLIINQMSSSSYELGDTHTHTHAGNDLIAHDHHNHVACFSSKETLASVYGTSHEDRCTVTEHGDNQDFNNCSRVEVNGIIEDLPVDIDFDLEEIKISSRSDNNRCNWDFDDLMFDMEI